MLRPVSVVRLAGCSQLAARAKTIIFNVRGIQVLKTIQAGLLILMLTVTTMVTAQTDSISVFSDFDGKPQQIESYTGNGKWLVVMIWASDCHICNAEAATYTQFYESQRGKGVGVLGISMDGEARKAAALEFVRRHEVSYPNLIGEPGMIGLYYAALTKEPLRGTPTFLVFDPDGELAAAQAGAVSPGSIERFIASKEVARSTAR